MAAALTTQVFPHAGASITYATAGGTLTQTGNTTPCGSGLGLLVKNSGASINVQITVPAAITLDGLGIASATPGSGFRSVTVPTGDAIIPLVASTYMDPATGLATFGFSATPTSVSVACVAISS
jgi:hypothetical protein